MNSKRQRKQHERRRREKKKSFFPFSKKKKMIIFFFFLPPSHHRTTALRRSRNKTMFLLSLLTLLPLALATRYDPELTQASLAPLVLSDARVERAASGALALTAHTDLPHGAADAAHLRLLYGASRDSLRACEQLVVLNAHAVQCQSVADGAGLLHVVVERLDQSGQVEARHRVDSHYPAPVVTALSGGDDGVALLVAGANFGPRDAALADVAAHRVEVFVGPFPAHSPEHPCAVVDDAGTQIRCAALPIGFGTGQRVTVCVGGVCGTSELALHDFAEPVVEKTFRVGARLHLVGHGFGPALDAEAAHLIHDKSSPALTLELAGRPCRNPEMIVADREIACDADEHVVTTETAVVLARRSVRAAVHVKRSTAADIQLESVSPKSGPTSGDFALTVYGQNFGRVGQSVLVLVGGRPAIDCVVSEAGGARDVAVCAKAPVGAGAKVEVRVGAINAAEAVGCAPNACTLSYDAPVVASVTRASTRGGSISIRGSNFGPSFVEKKVTLRIGGAEHACHVTRGTHDRIQCDAPAGSGESLVIVVEVAKQRSRPAREFSYRRPDIVSTTRPHWRGGHVYIRGYNFGTDSKAVNVYIGDKECRDPKITQAHRVLRCYAPPNAADGKFHHLTVRVDGVSSVMPTKDGKAPRTDDRVQYTNTAPEFLGAEHVYTAVAGSTLKIRLPTRDADGDDIYYRAHNLPAGAHWRQGDGYMQIDYNVPKDLVQYPRTEHTLAIEVSATDGPASTSMLVEVHARACAANQDACKDQSCAARNDMCPRCPISNVVRCPSHLPLLDPASGDCHPIDRVHQHNVTVGDVRALGYTFAVGGNVRLPLVDAENRQVGALISLGGKSLRAAAGPQPHGESLTCVEVAPCPHAPPRAASRAVHVQAAGAFGDHGLYLTLPTLSGDNSDAYGHCLGVYDKASMTWHCADEHLTVHYGSLGGRVHKDGCYALMQDSCPDVDNADDQEHGALCQGGATGCTDCNSIVDQLNVKYLKKNHVAAQQNEHSDCAAYQCPTTITTEHGDKFFSQL
jgi:hypothetical protein